MSEGVSPRRAWVTDANAALLTDLYQLKMLQAYLREGLVETAVFDLFARRLPRQRNYLVAAGLDDALHYLETMTFSAEALEYIASLPQFSREFVDYLATFRFRGDVYAAPEGTVVFAEEPIIEVVAPVHEAQLVESFLLNQIHFQTVVASKAARVVSAAGGRPVIEFGLRRLHGTDAGMKAARAAYIAGVAATSNVLAAQVYGIEPSGTMAHSYIEAHEDEYSAFREYVALYPDTVLLVDTYDTLHSVREVVRLARELGPEFRLSAIRLDSGDIATLAKDARQILDEGGLPQVEIFVSGSLDEYIVAELLEKGAPIDAFAVGTHMGISADAPYVDSAYKLVAYGGRGRMKLSTGKTILPGRKQVFRTGEGSDDAHDVIALHEETLPGRPLLLPVMRGGKRLPAGRATLSEARDFARDELARLPARLHSLAPADPAYRVETSPALGAERDRIRQDIERAIG